MYASACCRLLFVCLVGACLQLGCLAGCPHRVYMLWPLACTLGCCWPCLQDFCLLVVFAYFLPACFAAAWCNSLSVLWGRLQPEFARYGQFMTGTQHNSRQVRSQQHSCISQSQPPHRVWEAWPSKVVETQPLVLNMVVSAVLLRRGHHRVLWVNCMDCLPCC